MFLRDFRPFSFNMFGKKMVFRGFQIVRRENTSLLSDISKLIFIMKKIVHRTEKIPKEQRKTKVITTIFPNNIKIGLD